MVQRLKAPAAMWLLFHLCLVSTSFAGDEVVFEKHIRPVLKAHCFHCHGEDGVQEGELDLRLRRFMVQGGDSGAAIVAHRPSESLLLNRVTSGEMPPGDKRLSTDEIALIKRWIKLGAETARPEPETIDEVDPLTAEERAFWSFQPVTRPPLPTTDKREQLGSPIDSFVLARLREHNVDPSPTADRRTLLRRITFDLIGLPPTPEEIEFFEQDRSPDAYEQVVDRLLSSPAYGERWGRHWLDVAGYADSEGYTDDDAPRTSAFRYRDYVIESLNADKPFDVFVREQLAGDEMIEQSFANLSAQQTEKLAATGFLRMAPDGTASSGIDQGAARNEVMAGTLDIVSTSLLGLTVACARCHNHRYDPIPQTDYYRLRAIFEPALDVQKWHTPKNRLVSLYNDDDRAAKKEIEAEAAKVDAEREAKAKFYIDRTLEEELATLKQSLRDPLRKAFKTKAAERTTKQKALLKEHPSVANISTGSLYLYDRRREAKAGEIDRARVAKEKEYVAAATAKYPDANVTLATLSEYDADGAAEIARDKATSIRLRAEKASDHLKRFSDKAAEIRKRIPKEGFVRALTEPKDHTPPTHLFFRGDHEQPKQRVAPGELLVLTSTKMDVAEDDPSLPTTGRRLAYARHLTAGTHPLVGRVLVNRIWTQHFGRGIVNSPGDFGLLGERPTHPKLLDWLADEFVQTNWQLKRLHRMLVTSHTYRQSSARTSALDAVDPDNQLYGRMSIRRLEAEAVRDSVLFVGSTLNTQLYGEPVPVMEDAVGQIVIGKENLDGERKPTKAIDLGGQQFRRSIYVQVRRSRPLAVLETFDTPAMTPNCTKRSASNVAPQPLLLMNSDFAIAGATRLAQRLIEEAPDDRTRQIGQAWSITLGIGATTADISKAERFLDSQQQVFATTKKDASAEEIAQQSLATFCQALLSTNRFLYVD